MTAQISLDSADTSDEKDELIALMSKYVFEKQGIKLGRFRTFWVNFIEEHPEYEHLGPDDLRLFFVCNLIPTPFQKNTFNLPEEEYIYLKYGDYDPDEATEEESDGDEAVKVGGNDILVVRGENVVQNQFGWEAHLAFAHNLIKEVFAANFYSDSSDDD